MISSLLNEAQKFGRYIITTKNRSYWTRWKTRATINTLVRVNKKLIITFVNAINWTHIHAGRIFGSDARLGNHREIIHDLEYGREQR
jgi:hypothetical protein